MRYLRYGLLTGLLFFSLQLYGYPEISPAELFTAHVIDSEQPLILASPAFGDN